MSLYVQYLWRPEEGIESPGTRVTVGCEPSYVCWEVKPGLLGKQSELLTPEPEPFTMSLLCCYYFLPL